MENGIDTNSNLSGTSFDQNPIFLTNFCIEMVNEINEIDGDWCPLNSIF